METEQAQKKALDFLQEIVHELHQQHNKYPAGEKIRYEVYLGEDDSEQEEVIDAYYARVEALDQLKEEGIVTDYVIASKTEDFIHNEFAGTRIEYKVAKCILDKNKFKQHLTELYSPQEAQKQIRGLTEEEKKINKQTSEVLRDIREQFLVTLKGKPVKYRIPNVVGNDIIPRQRRIDILYKLEEQGAFEIQKGSNGARLTNQGRDAFYLIINQPRFDEICEEYKQKNNLKEKEDEPKQKKYNREEEGYYFKKGMPHAGCALELFIARKILDKKTRPIFAAKEFSFRQHSYAEICYVVDSFIEKGIVSVFPNTTPEDLVYSYEECEELFGAGEPCGIKWSVVKRVEKDPKELKWACFDFDVENEVQLRGIIDIGISEFMNDKRYGELGDLVDVASLSSNELSYEQQRGIVLKDMKENYQSEAFINMSDYPHPKVDIVRTLLSLEKEGVLRIKRFLWEYKKNPQNDSTDDDNIKDFEDKDEVYASVRLTQSVSKDIQHPLQVEIVGNSALTVTKEIRKSIPKNKAANPYTGLLKQEGVAGQLAYYNDGTVRYKSDVLPMRAQLRDICILFIKNPRQLITSDDIYDTLEKPLSKTTIAKYVSELHKLLREKYGHEVITNDKNNGWMFNPSS